MEVCSGHGAVVNSTDYKKCICECDAGWGSGRECAQCGEPGPYCNINTVAYTGKGCKLQGGDCKCVDGLVGKGYCNGKRLGVR